MPFNDLTKAILSQDLCMACGVCQVACPVDGIRIDGPGSLQWILGDNGFRCKNCQHCLMVCPGLDPDKV